MSKSNVFDEVMNYIDEHIKQDYLQIKRGIYAISNYSDMDFSKFLSILSEGKLTLGDYVARRKLEMIVSDLVNKPNISITNIALDYGYSEQSALSRAIKKQYNCTPREIRNKKLIFKSEKLSFNDFNTDNNTIGKRLRDSIDEVMKNGYSNDDGYFEEFVNALDEYGFDTSTCIAISEISERIGVPFGIMLSICFHAMVDYKSECTHEDPFTDKLIQLEISSYDEAYEICDFYKCEYYQINRFMVDEYRRNKKMRNENE